MFLLGQMVDAMKETTLMTKKKAKEYFIGLTEENMKEGGETVNNTVKALILLLAAKQKKVNGKKEKDFIGFSEIENFKIS